MQNTRQSSTRKMFSRLKASRLTRSGVALVFAAAAFSANGATVSSFPDNAKVSDGDLFGAVDIAIDDVTGASLRDGIRIGFDVDSNASEVVDSVSISLRLGESAFAMDFYDFHFIGTTVTIPGNHVDRWNESSNTRPATPILPVSVPTDREKLYTLRFDRVAQDNVTQITVELAQAFIDDQRATIATDDFELLVTSAAVPLPPAVWLFGGGLLALAGFKRTRQAGRMKQTLLQRGLATLACAAFSTAASAQLVAPTSLGEHEKVFWAAVEQATAISAAITDKTNSCSGSYRLALTVYDDHPLTGGAGADIRLDDLFFSVGVVDDGLINPGGVRGTRVMTATTQAGEVGDVDVDDISSEYVYSTPGEVMYGEGVFTLNGDLYDTHVLKDYFASTAFGGTPGIRDRGLEVITKVNYPRAKWAQRSSFVNPNGIIGAFAVTKDRIRIDGTLPCQLRISKANVSDFSNGLQAEATISLR